MTKFVMFFLAPWYRFLTYVDSLNKMKLRTKSEILEKLKEFDNKRLIAGRANNKDEAFKFESYVKVLRWVACLDETSS